MTLSQKRKMGKKDLGDFLDTAKVTSGGRASKNGKLGLRPLWMTSKKVCKCLQGKTQQRI